jgi:hypothetical protein
MLDYAADAIVYRPAESLRASFRSPASARQSTSRPAIAEFLGPGAQMDEFWTRVETNLQPERIRLVFVADTKRRRHGGRRAVSAAFQR